MRLLFFVLMFCLYYNHLWADKCKTLLGELGDKQQHFVYCATTKAVPVQLCTGCEPQYSEMVISYENLLNSENCSKTYFDHDRINIISTTQSILVGLWTKAYCDDCFSGNQSQVFDQLSGDFEVCLQQNKDKECLACLTKYKDLNDYYIHILTLDHHKEICFDVQDKMNMTRRHWSKDLNCCKRDFNIVLFLSFSITMSLLPIIFYGGIYAYGKRRERIHDVLNNEEAETATSIAATSLPAASNVENAVAAVSNNSRADNVQRRNLPQKKSIPSDSDSDETDEDMLKKR